MCRHLHGGRTMWSNEKIEEVKGKIAKKAMGDKEFRKKVMANPAAVIKEISGLDVPADFKVKVIENEPGVSTTFVLPNFVSADLDDKALDDVAGGNCKKLSCTAYTCASHSA